MQGKVAWFDAKKGFGFIVPDAGGPDIFVHYSGIEGSGYRQLGENQRVEFEVLPKSEADPRPKAVSVKVI